MKTYVNELLTGSGYLVVEVDENSPSPSYFSYMRPDGAYVLVKDTISGNVRSSRYLKFGTFDTYVANWANRASLTFDYPLETTGWA